jgi:hypothetical protein
MIDEARPSVSTIRPLEEDELVEEADRILLHHGC